MPFNYFERFIAFRYLVPLRKGGLLSVISWLSFIGICIGVATLIIVMSVMNGFQIEIKERMVSFIPHATIRTAEEGQSNQSFIETFENNPSIQSYSAFSESDVLILSNETINPIRLIAYENQNYLIE
mgnify:CR=1 FL=1